MGSIDYSKIIQRSWEITKKNKWLWVVGIVIAAFGGGSGGSGGGGGSSSSTSTNFPSKIKPLMYWGWLPIRCRIGFQTFRQ